MRTQEQIVQQIEIRKSDDFLGFETSEYLRFLDYEHAKPFLKEGVKPEEWEQPDENNTKSILKIMLDYIPFAWDKAKGCRGISASRSISHYKAWIWMLDDGFQIDEDSYCHYGKGLLRTICKQYGWNPNQWDDGIRVNEESELGYAKPIPELIAKPEPA